MEQISTLPTHVSIIMDGNGRWAKKLGKDRLEGHKEGVESVRACIELCVELKIKYLSIFAFSTENWGRPTAEVEGLWALMLKALRAELNNLMKNNVRLIFLGDLSQLGDELNAEINHCMTESAHNTGTNVIVMLNYSGKWDIVQAANRFIKENPGKELTPEEMDKYLITAQIPDPDLLIRTSGEQRISNYMLWQSAYTEFYFTETLWPDFRKSEFRLALDAFSHRERRYGKV